MATKCYFCVGLATTKNLQGIEVCKLCKDKNFEDVCPICQGELEVKTWKWGAYLKCWQCDRNWSKSKILRYKQ